MTHILRINEMAVRFKSKLDNINNQDNLYQNVINKANNELKNFIFKNIYKNKNYKDLLDTYKYMVKSNNKALDDINNECELIDRKDYVFATIDNSGSDDTAYILVQISKKYYGIEFIFDGESCIIRHPRGEHADMEDTYTLDDVLNTGFYNKQEKCVCYELGMLQPKEEHSIVTFDNMKDSLIDVQNVINKLSKTFFEDIENLEI